MKRNVAFLAFPASLAILFLGSVPAFAETRPPQTATKPAERTDRFDNPLLEDVVQMTRAQLPESSILAFVRSRRSRLDVDVTAADLIRLHRAGVSDHVIAYIARITGIEDRSSRGERDRGRYRDRDRDRDRDYDRDRDRDRNRDIERDRGDGDADGVVAYDGPRDRDWDRDRDRDRDDDGDIEAYGRPWRSVYDSWPGWWDYPYWWGVSPWWGSEIIFRGGGRFHGGRGRDHGSRGDGHWSSSDGASRSWGGSRGGGSRGGGSNWGGSHGGGSHGGGGGHHGGGGRH